MAGSFSDYKEAAVLAHFTKGTVYSQPTHIYVAAFTTMPTGNGAGGVEPAGNGYARVICDAWTVSGAEPAQAVNTSLVTFPTATPGSWGTIVGWGTYDDPAAGNLLDFATLSVNKLVGINDILEFLAGSIVTTLQ